MNDKQALPRNAFSMEYLQAIQEQDDASTVLEAATSGPLKLEADGGQLALLHQWESSSQGDQPPAVFHDRETALVFQSIWPAVGRSRIYRLHKEAGPGGFGLELEGEGVVGRLQHYLPDAVYAAHVASYLARTPFQLALLVEAAGADAQKMLGRLLAERRRQDR